MRTTAAALLLFAAACGNSDNIIVGGIGAGDTTPVVLFDNIGSSIHGIATLRDSAGSPIGDPMAVVIMSDRPNLCAVLKTHPDYFRNAPEAYQALILMVPYGFLGTFVIGRGGTDASAAAEIVAAAGPQVTTPFHGLNSSYINLTEWADNGGNAAGSFNLLFDDPYSSGIAHPFYGNFLTSFCPTLDGTLLP